MLFLGTQLEIRHQSQGWVMESPANLRVGQGQDADALQRSSLGCQGGARPSSCKACAWKVTGPEPLQLEWDP